MPWGHKQLLWETTLTLKLEGERLDLEADCDVNSFFLPVTGRIGAFHFVYRDLRRGEGDLSEDVHHGPGAAEWEAMLSLGLGCPPSPTWGSFYKLPEDSNPRKQTSTALSP